MRFDWKEYTLDDVCERIFSGGTPSTMHSEYWNGTLKWLSSKKTTQSLIYDTERKITALGVKHSSTKLATRGCTVIATAGQGFTRGQASFLMTDTFLNQSVIACKPNEKYVLPLFLYYNLDNRYDEFRLLSDGTSTRGGLSGWILKRMTIMLPPLSEQKKIAAILSALDEKIAINRAINDNLEQQAQAVHYKMFSKVNGEPVELSSIIDVRDGTHDSPKAQATGYYLITSKHLLPFGVDKASANRISKADFDKINERSLVETQDILMSMIGTIGLISYIPYEDVDFAIKNVALFKTSHTPELTYYFLCYLKSEKTLQHIEKCLAGSTQKYISLGELRKMPIYSLTTDEIREFNYLVKPIFEEIVSRTYENALLAEMRDALLPKLMSGEIDVSGIQI